MYRLYNFDKENLSISSDLLRICWKWFRWIYEMIFVNGIESCVQFRCGFFLSLANARKIRYRWLGDNFPYRRIFYCRIRCIVLRMIVSLPQGFKEVRSCAPYSYVTITMELDAIYHKSKFCTGGYCTKIPQKGIICTGLFCYWYENPTYDDVWVSGRQTNFTPLARWPCRY